MREERCPTVVPFVPVPRKSAGLQPASDSVPRELSALIAAGTCLAPNNDKLDFVLHEATSTLICLVVRNAIPQLDIFRGNQCQAFLICSHETTTNLDLSCKKHYEKR